MGGKKKTQTCGYIKPHPSHVWRNNKDGEPLDAAPKRFCPGVAQAKSSSSHVHIWDAANGPILREREIDAPGLLEVVSEPWNGPIECPCGLAAWLHDGVKKRDLPPKVSEVRFPQAEIMDRILALKSKLDRGDEMSDEDKAEFEAIAAALVEAFKPLVEAFQKMAEQVIEFLASFLDKLDPDVVRELHRLAQTYGEHTEPPVETIELRDAKTGKVIAEHIIGHDPIAASQHVNSPLVNQESVQLYIEPSVQADAALTAAQRAVREPFSRPFRIRGEY